MTVTAASGPRYRQIAGELAGQIHAGRWGPGDMLPGELDLCAHYGVSRHTARDALRLLLEQGLIRRRRGAGTQVVGHGQDSAFAQEWGGVGDILQYAREARLHVRALEPASGTILGSLGLDPQVPWQVISGLRRTAPDEPPLAFTRICVLAELMPSRADIEAWPGAIAELIGARGGPATRRVDQTITAVLLEREEARALGARTGEPALCTVRRYHDAGARVFQASFSLHPADRFAYHMSAER
jgi:GntR family transcriptional regulator